MAAGILATVEVHEPRDCVVTPLSEGNTVNSVSQGQPVDGRVPVEVTLDREPDAERGERVFGTGSEVVYRLDRAAGKGCACERIESTGCPIRDVRAEDGSLRVSFIAADIQQLRDVVDDLRDRASGVGVRCLQQSGDGTAGSELVYVDRASFTDRQREVLETAHEMGYFERPKRANATAVARELGIATATFAEHLAAAQTKLMEAVFEQ